MHEFGLNYISALKYSPFSASCYNNIIVNRNIPYRGIYFLCDTCTCIICVLAFWHNYKNANFAYIPTVITARSKNIINFFILDFLLFVHILFMFIKLQRLLM